MGLLDFLRCRMTRIHTNPMRLSKGIGIIPIPSRAFSYTAYAPAIKKFQNLKQMDAGVPTSRAGRPIAVTT